MTFLGEDLDRASEAFDFLDLLMDDQEKGEVRPLSDYLRRFPGHEDVIAREYLAFLQRGEEPRRNYAAEFQAEAREGLYVGPFRLIRELGRGGQGTVHLAHDARLDREVALKVIDSHLRSVSLSQRERFRREAAVVSRLDHPAICPVYEASFEGEVAFIAMRHVEGSTLAEELTRTRDSPSRDETTLCFGPRGRAELAPLLRFFERCARALHAAHDEGVVHRDVKPGNIMVTPEGEPVLLDFGLAQAEQENDGLALTLTGEAVGTPAYMSPEQLEGEGLPLDARTDVYSLAVTLLESLTLHRPTRREDWNAFFVARTWSELYEAWRHRTPEIPAFDLHLPRELKIVLETALDPDRQHRYATALELAEDLRRVRELEPITARPAGPVLRLRRWAQRHPAIAGASVAVGSLLVLGLVWTLVMLDRERGALRTAEASRLARLGSDQAESNPTLGLLAAIEASEREPTFEGRTALLKALERCREQLVIRGTTFAWQPGTNRIATSGASIPCELWDVNERRRLWSFPMNEGNRREVVFDSTGTRLAVNDGSHVLVVDSTSGTTLQRMRHRNVRSYAFDPTGQRLMTVGSEGIARLWHVGTEDMQEIGCGTPLTSCGFSPSGERAVVWSRGGRIRPDLHSKSAFVLDLARNTVQHRLEHGGFVHTASFASGEEQVVTSSEDGWLRVWGADTGQIVWKYDFGRPANAFDVSPDDHTLAIGFDPDPHGGPHASGLVIFDLEGRGSPQALHGHEGRSVWGVSFDYKGSRLATTSYDGTLRIWDLDSGQEAVVLSRHSAPFFGCTWSSDGRYVAASGRNEIHIAHAQRPPGLLILEGHGGPLTSGTFDSPGERVVTGSEDGTARVWNTMTGIQEAILEHDGSPVVHASFLADTELVVTVTGEGSAHLWKWRDELSLGAFLETSSEPVLVVDHPASRRVAVLTAEGELHVANAGRNESTVLRADEARIKCVAFSPDGRTIAAGDTAGVLHLWSLEEGGETLRVPLEDMDPDRPEIFSIAFDTGGKLLALGLRRAQVRILTTGGQEIFRKSTSAPGCVAFSPTGNRILATSSNWPTFMIWAVPSGDLHRCLGHTGKLVDGAFSSTGRVFVTSSVDGTARLWRTEDAAPYSLLAGHSGPLVTARFDPSGTRVLTVSQDRTARIWPVDPLDMARSRKPRELGTNELAYWGFR